METEPDQVSAFLHSTATAVESWLASIDTDTMIWTLFSVAVVIFFRKRVSQWAVSASSALLKRVSVVLSDEVFSQLRSAGEILTPVLALFIAVEILLPEGVIKLFLDRLLGSIAIVATFGTWYQLSGPFTSLLRNEKSNLVAMETDWVTRVVQFAVVLFGLSSLLKVWQVDISGALTGVGVLGAGLAIATQDLLRNLVAGMTNISEKRFETGDAIAVEGHFIGSVKRIDLRSTMIIGFDQIPRHIPNSDLSNAVVLNYSDLKHRRIMLKVPLLLTSTEDQISAVRDGLREYHRTSGDFSLEDAAPKHIYVSELSPSSIDIFIYAWTTSPEYSQYLQVIERLTLAILRITRDSGTELAFPTQTLRMDPHVPFQPPATTGNNSSS